VEYSSHASRSPQCLLADLASIQQAYVNTGHPDFIGGRQAIEAVFTHFQMLRQEQWVNKEQAIVHDAPDSTQTHTDIQQNAVPSTDCKCLGFHHDIAQQ
jgi:hypothetical protein